MVGIWRERVHLSQLSARKKKRIVSGTLTGHIGIHRQYFPKVHADLRNEVVTGRLLPGGAQGS